MQHSPSSPIKSTEEKSNQDVEITRKDAEINGETMNENDDIEAKAGEEPEDVSMADIDKADPKPDPEANEENAVPAASIETNTAETNDDVSQDDDVVVKEEVVEENNIAVELESDDKSVPEL